MISTDSSPIIQLFDDRKDEYIFEISKYVNLNCIKNNIFGYELTGIKIINITKIINNGIN